jgi:hypothetical protein
MEYGALRDTIRERGTARIWVFVVGLAAWAALVVATAALAAPPIATLVPLALLAAVFEGVFALHVTVERIGRYLAVAHADAWEGTASQFGRPRGAIALDPLFVVPFLAALVINLYPLLPSAPTLQEIVFVAGSHALVAIRILWARAAAARQRAIDEERFVKIKRGES